jgi:flavin-dependent dehydrogenase
MYDLIVIGGGPAGASAAITAAQGGATVLLLERGKLPRHKVCGEFVSAESLDLLGELLIPEYAGLVQQAERISRARLFLDGHVLSSIIDPPAASIARLDLDSALWECAGKCGVNTLQQIVAQNISGAGPFQVETPTGGFEARTVINASGRWSNLGGHDREQQPNPKWLGIKAHFAEPEAANSVDLYFFEGGYCGVQPVALRNRDERPGRLNACAMVRADVATSLMQVFACHSDLSARSRCWQALSEPISTSPLVFRHPETARHNVLITGDAAAFVDPFVGDGISLALRSGSLAAKCLGRFLDGNESLSQAASKYGLEYRRQFRPIFRTSARIRRMLLMPRMIRKSGAALLARRPELTRYLIRKTR